MICYKVRSLTGGTIRGWGAVFARLPIGLPFAGALCAFLNFFNCFSENTFFLYAASNIPAATVAKAHAAAEIYKSINLRSHALPNR